MRYSPSGSGRPQGVLIAAYGSVFWPVTERVEDQDRVITNNALQQHFSPLGEEPVDNVVEKSEQIHVACTLSLDRKRKLRHRS